MREKSFTRLAELVRALVPILLPQLDLPFAFFGHSMGALVAFELARELRTAHGLDPVHLFASGYRAPQVPLDRPIYMLPETEFVGEMRRRYGGIPEEILRSREVVELLFPRIRADIEVCDTYSYAESDPLDCPITAFGGSQDTWVSQKHLEAWRHQTSRSFNLRMFPGGHFFVEGPPAALLQAVAGELAQSLE